MTALLSTDKVTLDMEAPGNAPPLPVSLTAFPIRGDRIGSGAGQIVVEAEEMEPPFLSAGPMPYGPMGPGIRPIGPGMPYGPLKSNWNAKAGASRRKRPMPPSPKSPTAPITLDLTLSTIYLLRAMA